MFLHAQQRLNQMDEAAALAIACEQGLLPEAAALLDRGVDALTAVTSRWLEFDAGKRASLFHGVTGLHQACYKGHAALCELLLARGGDALLDAVCEDEQEKLCGVNGHANIVKMLVDKGEQELLMARSAKEETCLHEAARAGVAESVEILAQKGGKELLFAEGKGRQKTALDMAENLCSMTIARILYDKMFPLIEAARQGRRGEVEELLARGADVMVRDNTGVTCFMAACEEGHEELASLLLERVGQELVTGRADDGTSVLQKTCLGGHEGLACRLLERWGEAMLADQAENVDNILHSAVHMGHKELAALVLDKAGKGGRERLLEGKDGDGVTCLSLACSAGRKDIVALLLKHGGSKPSILNARSSNGQSALIICAMRGHEDIGKELIDAGADVNMACRRQRESPLIHALRTKRNKLALALISAGASLNAYGKERTPALLLAIKNCDDEVTVAMISAKAEVRAVGRDYDTPLLAAIRRGKLGLVPALLDAGSDVNAVGAYHDTPLIVAVKGKHEALALELIGLGVDVQALDANCETALVHAVRVGLHDAVAALIRSKADVKATDMFSQGVLSLAVKQRHHAIVLALLDAGADLFAVGTTMQTCLHEAFLVEHEAIVSVLYQRGGDVLLGMQNIRGQTALQLSVQHGKTRLAGRFEWQRKALSFSMALQQRLGQGSPASVLSEELVKLVMTRLEEGDCVDAPRAPAGPPGFPGTPPDYDDDDASVSSYPYDDAHYMVDGYDPYDDHDDEYDPYDPFDYQMFY